MTLQQMKQIFQRAVSDFEKGKNSTDAISAIAERLFGLLQEQSASDPDYIGLKDILDAAAELGFYIRLSEPAIFTAILRDVRSYANERETPS